jgi:hypothetical protein
MLPTLLHDPSFSLTISQQGIHTRGYNNPGLAGSPRPRCGGLQSHNRIVTPTGTTPLCKAWSFTEGFKPRVKPNASLSANKIQGNTPTSVKHSNYELTDLRDYFRSSSEDSIQLSTPDRALPVLLLLNQNLYKWRTRRVWFVLNSTPRILI